MSGRPIPVKRVVIASLLVLTCTGVFWWFAYGPEARYQRAVKRYPAGTPVGQILEQHGGKVQVMRTGNVLPFEPREDEKRRYVFYYLLLPRENAEVVLNYYQEVIRIEKLSAIGEPR